MIKIIEKEDFDLGNKTVFDKGVENTNKYFEMICSVKEASDIAENVKNYEIFDVRDWKELENYNIDYKIAKKFVKDKKYFAIPILVAKKNDDEYEHFIPKIRFDRNMVDEFDDQTKLGYGILNTDDENTKVICKVIYFEKGE